MKIACISDVHGNHYALSKVLRYLDRFNVDQIIFLGDAIGYFPSLKPIDILEKRPDIMCIKGNHEIAILENTIIPEKDILYRHQDIANTINPKQIESVESWKDYVAIETAIFFHGGPNNFSNQYIYPDTNLDDIYTAVKSMNEDLTICVTGHTHRPFIKQYKDILFVNAGSAGLPRDHGAYGSFAVIDTQANTADIYRFDLTDEQNNIINDYPETHQTVIDLFSRNKQTTPLGVIV